MAARKTQKERRETTTEKILESATKLFGQQGYEKTSIEDIAKHAGITGGPVYHYFGNKIELFSAINVKMEQILINKLDDFAQNHQEKSLLDGWNDFLEVCKVPGFVQIVLIDAPHILGKDNWKDSEVLKKVFELFPELAQLSQLEGLLDNNGKKQNLSAMDIELILRMFTAALAEAALMIGHHPEYDSRPIIHSLLSMIEALTRNNNDLN